MYLFTGPYVLEFDKFQISNTNFEYFMTFLSNKYICKTLVFCRKKLASNDCKYIVINDFGRTIYNLFRYYLRQRLNLSLPSRAVGICWNLGTGPNSFLPIDYQI